MTKKNKSFTEEFARFFEQPTRQGLSKLIHDNVGETDQLDFKRDWIPFPIVARHILAIANSGGGCIVFGVAEKDQGGLEACGLSATKDKATISKGLDKFFPEQLSYEVLDFVYSASEYSTLIGKKFQVVLIEDAPEYLPFVSKAESASAIDRAVVYVRRKTASEKANYEELQSVLNRRIQTGFSTQGEFNLQKEFQELKLLYGQVERSHLRGGFAQHVQQMLESTQANTLLGTTRVPNPAFPDEDLESFAVRMIEVKKQRIQKIIGN